MNAVFTPAPMAAAIRAASCLRGFACVLAAAILATAFLSGRTQAAPLPAAADAAPGRYTMQPVEEGFLRLDTLTGAVSVCTREDAGEWVCRPARDERSKLEEENARLRADIAILQEQVKELGAEPRVTTPEDVDAAMAVFEKVAESFGRMVRIMREEMEEIEREAAGE